MRDKPSRIVQTAYAWHGGQSSALYSFASTGGVVWSEDHRRGLLVEVDGCRNYVYVDPRSQGREARKLDRLRAHVSKAKIGYCYESRRMVPRGPAR